MARVYPTKDTPPPGYKILTEGRVRRTDLVWNAHDKIWNRPNNYSYAMFGSDVNGGWFAVARKIGRMLKGENK